MNSATVRGTSIRLRLSVLLIALAAVLAGMTSYATPSSAGVDTYPSKWSGIAQDTVFDDWGESNRECTSYVAWMLHSENGFEMPFHGNADVWKSEAHNHGFQVDGVPAKGAVGWKMSSATVGHVVWVESVNGDGTVTVEDYNADYSGHWGEHTVSSGAYQYIHFKDLAGTGAGTNPPSSDTDADGVPDPSDQCPTLPGPSYPNGCTPPFAKMTGDFTGDGKSDVAAFYRYDGNLLELFVYPGNGDGTFGAPIWGSEQTGWSGYRTIPAGVGDFNGDGKLDVAAFFRYDGGALTLFVYPGNGNGTFGNPTPGWSAASGWDGSRVLTAGVADFNGDGKPDISAFYRYDGGVIELFTFTGNGNGTFGGPIWGVGQSGFDGLRIIPAGVGDFTGDGKPDVAVFFRYDGNEMELFVFPGNGDGTFGNPLWGLHLTGWDGFHVNPVGVGDFNADGKLDVTVVYRYDSNQIELFDFSGNGNGTFGAPVWGSDQTAWDGLRTIPSGVADFNGDGRPDVSMFYRYDSNAVELFDNAGNPDGTFAAPTWGRYQTGWDGFRVIT